LLNIIRISLIVLVFSVFITTRTLAGTIELPKTGQITSFVTGDDGDIQAGVAWPNPRFHDNRDGTMTDNLTGLMWLKDADCFGETIWDAAVSKANLLANGSCGLSDNSTERSWRLPNINELESLVNIEMSNSAEWLNNQGFCECLTQLVLVVYY